MSTELVRKTEEISDKLRKGELTYDEAKKELQPFIDRANIEASKIAKKHGYKHKPFTFSYLMR